MPLAAGAHALPIYSVVPFVLVLLGIALLPLVAGHWWSSNKNKLIFAAVLAVPTGGYLASIDGHFLSHAGLEYVSFIALLGSLYIIAGGIVLRGDLSPTPLANTGLLALGSVIASLVGTTGASMLLIRPFLRANRVRSATRHLPIFFIFIVSNAGGLLTPLGDPPLFLGFLRGVPFLWTLGLYPAWILANATLLALFYLFDLRAQHAEGAPAAYERAPVSFGGLHNLLFLGGVIASAALLPMWYREGGMALMTALSLATTKKALREENGFTYHPIEEVAVLFAAIFVTMQPALAMLQTAGPELGLTTPGQFFWVTGLLSSVLDNAPTYVTFFTVAQSLGATANLVAETGVAAPVLTAVSLGAVFMGANTYIGNGPNFMVKAICDEAGFATPSFFGYVAWAGAILGPLWVLTWLVFF